MNGPALEIQSSVPLYVRVASLLRTRISNGEWTLGMELPAIPRLCEEYKVGTVTVRRALQILTEEGLVVSRRGLGTVVTKELIPVPRNHHLRRSINDPLELGNEQSIKMLLKQRVRSLPADLRSFRPQHDGYVRIKKLHLHRGVPFGVMDMYVQARAFDRFPKHSERREKIARLLLDHAPVRPVTIRHEMTIVEMDAELARLLGAKPNDYAVSSAVVRILRWWMDEKENVCLAGIHQYRADMYVQDIESKVSDFLKASKPSTARTHPPPGSHPPRK